MVNTGKYHGKPGHRGGFTIVECLIGLAISAMLLTAVAVAFSASATNYRANEEIFWTVNNARQALLRMTSQLRTAGYEMAPGLFLGVDPAAPSHQCHFYTPTGEYYTYEFRAADRKLYLIKNATSQEYVLCDDVVAASFEKLYNSEGFDCRSVLISLTVQKGTFERVLAAAAVVRRCPP